MNREKLKDARVLLIKFGETLADLRNSIDELSDEEKNTEEAQQLIEKEREITELFEYYRTRLDTLDRIDLNDKEAVVKAGVELDIIFNQLKAANEIDNYEYDAAKAKSDIKEAVDKAKVEEPEKDNAEDKEKDSTDAKDKKQEIIDKLAGESDAPETENENNNAENQTTNDGNEANAEPEPEDLSVPRSSSEEAYKSLLENRIDEIKAKIARLEKLEKYDLTGHTATQIIGFKIELKKIEEAAKNVRNRQVLDEESETKIAKIDQARVELDAKEESYNEEIERLKAQKEQVTGRLKKRKIAKQIKDYERKISLLHVSKIEMRDKQKAIMYPKQKVEFKRQRLISKEEGKIVDLEEKISINDTELQSMLDSDSAINGIRANHYDSKGNRYRRKLERSQRILEAMQNAPTPAKMRAARRMVISQSRRNDLSNGMQPQAGTQMV